MVQQHPYRRLLHLPLLVSALLVLGLLAPASGAAAPPVDNPGKGGRNPGFYSNPLEPQIPGDGVVESCADPFVIQGQQPGDTTWYMYCTTDPLNDEDLDANGDLIFHRIPTMTSEDLVNWTYVGDAFSTLPDWADPEAALWAPDVVYSSTYDQYYMFVGVTNTTAEVSGEENCNSDNAIGVATSDSPTGPWEFSDEPVVYPRRGGAGCNFLWTYDPDVLGDSVGTESILYYGSYYGGVYGTELKLTEDGAWADEAATMVAIDNKYEGTNVVYKDGYYYMFVSATNCCNGALTGYSVFVGRSTDPLGPFVDQQGNLLTDAQAGGTPFLTMNGNRWVGTGHNVVFQDAAGDWWTIYHAVDQADPFFETAPGFTKRPALLDAVDWVDGWPTVNGGEGPSDSRMPAPAGQEGEVSRHRTRLVAVQEPHRLLAGYSDEFDGTTLDPAWSWLAGSGVNTGIVPPPETTVAGGVLTTRIQGGDLYVDADSAYVLVREAPRPDYVIETKVRVSVPDDGCCFNYAQAGLLVLADEDNYVKLTNTSIWNTRQTEFAKEISPVPEGWARYGNTVVGPPSEEWTYLRIVVERLTGAERRAAGGDTESYTAYTSQDGVNWVRGGTWTHSLGSDAQIALGAYGGGGDFTAEFDYVRVYSLKERPAGR